MLSRGPQRPYTAKKQNDFLIYGRYGPLDMLKRLSRGVGTFSTPGKPHSENFLKSTCSTQILIFLYMGAMDL